MSDRDTNKQAAERSDTALPEGYIAGGAGKGKAHFDEARNIKKGQRISLRPDGQGSFVVQDILKRGYQITFITDQGVPVDVDEDDTVHLG